MDRSCQNRLLLNTLKVWCCFRAQIVFCNNTHSECFSSWLGLCHDKLTPETTPRLHNNVVVCCIIVTWGIFSAIINSLNNSIHPKNINKDKFSEDGVWIPCGGVVNNDHLYRSPHSMQWFTGRFFYIFLYSAFLRCQTGSQRSSRVWF